MVYSNIKYTWFTFNWLKHVEPPLTGVFCLASCSCIIPLSDSSFHLFIVTKLLPSVLQFFYHAWITDPKAALRARGKEKRKFWKKYTKGVRHRKSKKEGKQSSRDKKKLTNFRVSYKAEWIPCSFSHSEVSLLYFSRSCNHRGRWAVRWARKRRGEQEV